MISGVDEKTYEFGMLRALGLEKSSLITLLVLEGLAFALPGLFLGVLMAFLLNSAVAYIFFSSAKMITSYQLDPSAVLLGIGLGLFIPLVSNYFPI